jgi:hypothetical protein
MLYARRKRLKDLAEAEARGKSLWSAHFDEQARWKLVHAFRDACPEHMRETYAETARALILRDEGLPYLIDGNLNHQADLLDFLLKCEDELAPSAIEAIAKVFSSYPYGVPGVMGVIGPVNSEGFAQSVNTILREHRIGYELVDHEMIPVASKELHTEVVAPTLRLLSGRSGWDKVESAYQDALAELSDGKPADAITDAGTALQEALVLLGCKGNALGPLIKSARNNGLFAAHDSAMTQAIEGLMNWVSADRSESGDGHHVVAVTIDDAWLAVHVVGALILRLAGSPRGQR